MAGRALPKAADSCALKAGRELASVVQEIAVCVPS